MPGQIFDPLPSRDREGAVRIKPRGDIAMRFMMLMIPKGYEKAQPGVMPDAKAVAAMMKYNEALQKAGVLLALDGRARHLRRRQAQGDRWALHRGEGGYWWILDDSGQVEGGGGGMGIAL